MKKIFTMLAASAALLGATSANAATWTPTGTWVFEGTLTMQKGTGPIIDCATKATVVNDGTNANATVEITGGDWQCGTVSFTGNPYAVVVNSTGAIDSLTLKNVYVNTSITL